MNKSELIHAMAEKANMTKADAAKALNAFIAAVGETLKAGEKVTLVGFGTFIVSQRSERKGVNPTTKQPMVIPAKKTIRFKPGTDLEME